MIHLAFIFRGIKNKLSSKQIFSDTDYVMVNEEKEFYRKELLKQAGTPIPRADIFDVPTESDVRIPRSPRHAALFYILRWNSTVLRTVCLKIKQEIFRETLKEGYDYIPRFALKCHCGAEFDETVDHCESCLNTNLKEPEHAQKKRWEDFTEEVNKAEQSFLMVLQENEDDLNTHDDAYLVLVKEYAAKGDDLIVIRIHEIIRGNPLLFRIVADNTGRRGGRWYACPLHRGITVQESPGYCKHPGCNFRLQDVHYVETESGGKDPVKYYIKGEVIHFSKYEPSKLYGLSPIFSLWVIVRTLMMMDRYVQQLYEKGRMKGVLGVSTDNMDFLKKWVDDTLAQLRKDPHYIPVVAMESGEGGKGDLKFVKMLDSLREMDYGPAKDMMRQQVAALYGVMPVFQADVSSSGGLNNEGLQITVTDRAVEWGQSIYHNLVFPKIAKELGITDWKIQLKPSREIDEMARLQRFDLKVTTMQKMLDAGYEVKLKGEEFVFSGTATKKEDFTFPTRTPLALPGGAGAEIPDNSEGMPCPPGKHRTVDNPRCHPYEWDIKNKNKARAPIEVFKMVRKKDMHGKSGTGEVGAGIIFADGKTIFRWNSENPSINHYDSFEDFQKVHVKDHEENETELRFLEIDETKIDKILKSILPNELLKAARAVESGRKLNQAINKIESIFGKTIIKLYEQELERKIGKLKIKDPKKLKQAIEEITEELQPRLEKLAFSEVIQAYQKGKQLDFAKQKINIDWAKLPYSKSDIDVLRAIFSRNPFWKAFSSLTQSISDKFKEIITESYMAPTEKQFRKVLKDVMDQYPTYSSDRQMAIAYGRIGKFSLTKTIEEMKRTVDTDVYRLERIARSETTAIVAKGREISYREKDPENKNKYDWFGVIDHRTSDQCKEIEKRVDRIGKGKGVTLDQLQTIMKDVVDEFNRGKKSKWIYRDWLPHANCRRSLRRVV